MPVNEPLSITVIVSGLCSGAIFGAAIVTETERKVRRNATGWSLFSNSHLLGVVLNQILWMIGLATIFLVVGVAILRIGNAYPLSQTDRYTLGVAWLVGLGTAKWLRYLYWKRHA